MPQLKSITNPRAKHSLLLLIVLLLIASGIFLPHVDYTWTQELNRNAWPAFKNFFSRTIFQGDLPGAGDLPILGMILVAVFYIRAYLGPRSQALLRWRPALGFIIFGALVNALCFVHGTKWAMGRARPSVVFKKHLAFSDWYEFGPHFISEGAYRGSFPSGHTNSAFLLMLLAYALAGNPKHSLQTRLTGWFLGLGSLGFAASMAIARSMAFSHWISDGIIGMLLAWALIHINYFWILRVPEQNLYYSALPDPRKVPLLWELRLGIWVIGFTVGLVCLVFGMRAFFLPVSGWYVLLAPVGLSVSIFFAVLARRLYRRFSLPLKTTKANNGPATG